MEPSSAPRLFWGLAGIALLLIAAALGWRIVASGQQPVAVAAEGFSVTLGAVQQNIAQAQESVTAASKQAEAQRVEIVELERRLAAEQAQVSRLVVEIRNLPHAPAPLAEMARTAQAAATSAPSFTRVDPQLLANAQTKLIAAQKFATQLTLQKH
jgi:hypothetical protein